MIITITGDLGSGKSTVARTLAERLGYGFFSTGDAFRQLGAQRGLSVMELSELAKTDRSIDDYLDGILRNFDGGNYVIDARMAWHFIEGSFKIYLQTDVATAAGRIMRAGRKSEQYASQEEAAASISLRKAMEEERYRRLYGVALNDPHNFDLVLDTADLSPEDTVERILRAVSQQRN